MRQPVGHGHLLGSFQVLRLVHLGLVLRRILSLTLRVHAVGLGQLRRLELLVVLVELLLFDQISLFPVQNRPHSLDRLAQKFTLKTIRKGIVVFIIESSRFNSFSEAGD